MHPSNLSMDVHMNMNLYTYFFINEIMSYIFYYINFSLISVFWDFQTYQDICVLFFKWLHSVIWYYCSLLNCSPFVGHHFVFFIIIKNNGAWHPCTYTHLYRYSFRIYFLHVRLNTMKILVDCLIIFLKGFTNLHFYQQGLRVFFYLCHCQCDGWKIIHYFKVIFILYLGCWASFLFVHWPFVFFYELL